MKAKRLLSAALALVLCASMAYAPISESITANTSVITASADTYDDFEYKIYDDSITITKYIGKGGNVVIPSKIEGKKVTSIGKKAFYDCTSLTSVIIPDSVISIGDGAFSRCTSLTGITIPNSVTIISDYVFSHCKKMTNVTIGNSVKSIGNLAFSSCTSLTDITIPDSVTSIGYSAFFYCQSLASVTIPDSVTIINCGVFEYCDNLKSITIPDSVTSIESLAFARCYSLKNINIPDSVTDIGPEAFIDCTSLKIVTLPTSIQWISAYALGYTKSEYYADRYDYIDGFTLYCHHGVGEDYAKKNGINYKLVSYDLADAEIKLTKGTSYVYTGKAIKPAVTVKLSGKTLKKGTDYTAAYKNNKNCGKATVTVNGMNDYDGSASGSFIIKPKRSAAKKTVSPKKKQIKVTWKKTAGGVTGYQVQIALNKKFTKARKTYVVKKADSVSKTIKGLRSKKVYYTRVRAYKTVASKNYYGAWSGIKKARCK